MEYLPFGFVQYIGQYTGDVFPTDIDVIQSGCGKLLKTAMEYNRHGQFRLLTTDCFNQRAIRWNICQILWECNNQYLQELLTTNCPLRPDLIDVACTTNNVEAVSLLIKYNCPMNSDVINSAVRCGSVECLKLVVAAKCPINDFTLILARNRGIEELLDILSNYTP